MVVGILGRLSLLERPFDGGSFLVNAASPGKYL